MRLVFIFLFILSSFSFAPISAAENGTGTGAGIGYQPMIFNINIEDPNGDVDSIAGLYPLSAFYAIDGGRDIRYLINASYVSGEVDAGVKQIGQEFTAIFFGAGIQRKFRLGRSWKPWVGASVTYINAKYQKRYEVDADGFLVTQYPDRDESGFGLTVTASSYWPLNDNFDIGLHAAIDVPINTDITRAGIGLSLLF